MRRVPKAHAQRFVPISILRDTLGLSRRKSCVRNIRTTRCDSWTPLKVRAHEYKSVPNTGGMYPQYGANSAVEANTLKDQGLRNRALMSSKIQSRPPGSLLLRNNCENCARNFLSVFVEPSYKRQNMRHKCHIRRIDATLHKIKGAQTKGLQPAN